MKKISMKKVLFCIALSLMMLCCGTAFGQTEGVSAAGATTGVQTVADMTKSEPIPVIDGTVPVLTVDQANMQPKSPEVKHEPIAAPELSMEVPNAVASEQSVKTVEPTVVEAITEDAAVSLTQANEDSGAVHNPIFNLDTTETEQPAIVEVAEEAAATLVQAVEDNGTTPNPELVLEEDQDANMALEFTENGDILAVYGLGENSGVCAEVLGKWFPDGNIAMYHPADNPIGPAIWADEDETGHCFVGINGYKVEYTEEFENSAQIIIRLLNHLVFENLADKVFDENLTYAVITIPTMESIEVDYSSDSMVLVGIPDRELTGTDFVNMVTQLQNILN